MKRMKHIKPALLIASAATATVLLGSIGGATMALWHAEQSFTSEIKTGKVAFAVGAPGSTLAQTANATGDKLDFSFGKAEAATLLDKLEVAIPIQVDSLSQGNKGMRYAVTPPEFGADSLFGAAKTELVRVDSAADCKVDPRPQLPASVPADYYKRTPVSSDYSADTAPKSEFWCLVATLGQGPGLRNLHKHRNGDRYPGQGHRHRHGFRPVVGQRHVGRQRSQGTGPHHRIRPSRPSGQVNNAHP